MGVFDKGDLDERAAVMRLLDERAIERLLVRYCRLVDDGYGADVSRLFDPDGRLDLMGRVAVGRAAIDEVFAAGQGPNARPSTTHMLSNIEIEIDGPTARCVSDLTVVNRAVDGACGVTLLARYHDELRRTDEWRFTTRRVVVHARDQGENDG